MPSPTVVSGPGDDGEPDWWLGVEPGEDIDPFRQVDRPADEAARVEVTGLDEETLTAAGFPTLTYERLEAGTEFESDDRRLRPQDIEAYAFAVEPWFFTYDASLRTIDLDRLVSQARADREARKRAHMEKK